MGLLRKALDGEELVELIAVHTQPARDTDGAAGKDCVRSKGGVGVGEVDGGLQSIFGDAGVERQRSLAVDPQLELVQEPGPLHVEAELALGQVREVAAPIGDEESLVVLQDQLGKIGGNAGGEDVVVLADEDAASRINVMPAASAR